MNRQIFALLPLGESFRLRCLRLCLIVATLVTCLEIAHSPFAGADEQKETWKAGVAKTIITPKQSMWMSGYAARTKPSEGKVHDLRAKALALEDPQGTRIVIITVHWKTPRVQE